MQYFEVTVHNSTTYLKRTKLNQFLLLLKRFEILYENLSSVAFYFKNLKYKVNFCDMAPERTSLEHVELKPLIFFKKLRNMGDSFTNSVSEKFFKH